MEDDALRDTPLISLTVLTDTQDLIRGLGAGADFYVINPYQETYLLSRIHAALPMTSRSGVERKEWETLIDGKRLQVSADDQQMLNLLVSVDENAVLQYRDLLATQDEFGFPNERLEEKVRRKTAALPKSEARLSALVEASPVCGFETDAQGGLPVRQ